MGLDMYLTGHRYFHRAGKPRRKIGERKGELIDLGYWRKHPNLHGFIVQTFAGGVDECQEIDLSAEDIGKIITAVESEALPLTTGFSFGESDGSEKKHDLLLFRNALSWLEEDDPGAWRGLYYQASW
jgi:hypothetical protein